MTTMMSNLSPKDFEHVFCLDIPTQTYNERIFRLVAAYHLLLYIMFFLIVSCLSKCGTLQPIHRCIRQM